MISTLAASCLFLSMSGPGPNVTCAVAEDTGNTVCGEIHHCNEESKLREVVIWRLWVDIVRQQLADPNGE